MFGDYQQFNHLCNTYILINKFKEMLTDGNAEVSFLANETYLKIKVIWLPKFITAELKVSGREIEEAQNDEAILYQAAAWFNKEYETRRAAKKAR